ncbi:hypothetical protein C900_03083 [Fulvivirga imtechensis AK7]|uniref:Globin domain-containing protein n=1 Tax=Fulvivirga imtechensis AK7 TaxID=1237149 RepID=L8JU91_9BACT|nr:globin [Fulvivirga imtechensis]ELR71119.1 hypothetical protein C900_03083 [Fulvivirga imtechensis AK7]
MEQTMEIGKITLVQNSYGRCLSSGKLLETFYENFLSSSRDVADKFRNTDFEQQRKLLRHGINLMIMYAAGNIAGQTGLKRIKESHSRGRMNIEPRFYALWKAALIKAIAEHDRDFNVEIKAAWNEVLDKGIVLITEGY